MMKRIVAFALAGLGIAALTGCPVYTDDGGLRRVCDQTGCYSCDDGYYATSDCEPWSCNSSYDCPDGYSCNNYACTTGSSSGSGTGTVTTTTSNPGFCNAPGDCPNGETCGSNNQCYAGTDCVSVGCPNPYVCEIANGGAVCIAGTSDGGVYVTSDAGVNSDDGGLSTSDATVDGSSTDSGLPAPQCSADADCSSKGTGYKCLDGTCVAPVDQCTDGTQCVNGESCVAGACTPSCVGGAACPTGYGCDTTKGVCTVNPTPCGTGADASVCGAGTVCSDQHCVPSCASGDSASCPTGDVCVGGGCIPDQKPVFVCNADGVGTGCASGSECLHHACYIACAIDASNACVDADRFNVCKPVTTSSGTYDVCGSSSNLGSDCDPTMGKACTNGQVCIDGYCH